MLAPERLMQVQRDNEILVAKISKILHHQTLPVNDSDQYLPNLSNVAERRARLRKIEDENLVRAAELELSRMWRAHCPCAFVAWTPGIVEAH